MILPFLPPAVRIVVEAKPKAISPDLFGIFFEDLNSAADGGLYAELVQNRSFEYDSVDQTGWNGMTAWTLVKENGGEGRANVRSGPGLNANNPHYVSVFAERGRVGLRNAGYDGIAVRRGEAYDLSLWACAFSGEPGPIEARLETKDGAVLARTTLAAPKHEWNKLKATLTPSVAAVDARLVVLVTAPGATGLDMVSLFPRATFKGRPNGLRADLAGTIADLHPKFVRFPGGCVVHGNRHGLSAMYDWKTTIGPVEARREMPNGWNYHQSMGLGYYEYFQFCEDIGAKPLPVVPAAVSCQNTDTNWGKGQEALTPAQTKAYIGDVLDLVEWANGPANSKWGAKRAAQGHPKPFGLEYLAIGNEEAITPLFENRFKTIYEAVHARYPKLKLIGTVGPFPDGEDFDAGWRLARKERVGLVDEHYYKSPDWFWDSMRRYDGYDRAATKVYAGEYAAHEPKRENTLRAALAEAAYLTSLERNGDVVQLSSYAPLLCKQGHVNWRPDMIYFDNLTVAPSVNYEVQRLFMRNAGDEYLPSRIEGPELASSVVRDSKTGDVIVKLVSRASAPTSVRVDLSGVAGLGRKATRTVLAGDPLTENPFGKPAAVLPKTAPFEFKPTFAVEVPPTSLTVIRIENR